MIGEIYVTKCVYWLYIKQVLDAAFEAGHVTQRPFTTTEDTDLEPKVDQHNLH